MQTLDRGQRRRIGDLAKMGVSVTEPSVIAGHPSSGYWEPRLDRRLDDIANERRRLADLHQAGLIEIIEMPASARPG